MTLFQEPLFQQSFTSEITVSEKHPLVLLTHIICWDQLILLAMNQREQRGKKNTGKIPQYRQLLGALTLMAIKNIGYREIEDLVSHYAPARYLCDLIDSDKTLDHVTIFDFHKMMGAQGMEEFNNTVLRKAEDHGLIVPTEMMSDTTAQEAMIPYPNEVGLMGRFMEILKDNVSKLGGKFQSIKTKIKEKQKEVKALIRNSHLFAKTKEEKRKVGKKLYHVTKEIQEEINSLLEVGCKLSSKAGKEVTRINDVMKTLFPQILYFLETGFVANKKIIHLQMKELYAIVRGKAGKNVEFGLKWGINRIAGGFIQGYLMDGVANLSDKKFAIEALKKHKETFGFIPKTFGYDRGAYSEANIKKAKKMGVQNVGIAPKGQNEWEITDENLLDHIKCERAQVEGCIGTIKHKKYGFNKPNARSVSAMVAYGHRAILGFNLNKLIKISAESL